MIIGTDDAFRDRIFGNHLLGCLGAIFFIPCIAIDSDVLNAIFRTAVNDRLFSFLRFLRSWQAGYDSDRSAVMFCDQMFRQFIRDLIIIRSDHYRSFDRIVDGHHWHSLRACPLDQLALLLLVPVPIALQDHAVILGQIGQIKDLESRTFFFSDTIAAKPRKNMNVGIWMIFNKTMDPLGKLSRDLIIPIIGQKCDIIRHSLFPLLKQL